VKPSPAAVPVPKADAVAAPKRNPRIKLFASADQRPELPPAPSRDEDSIGGIIDPAEFGREAGQANRVGRPAVKRKR
jgi:hypothetical protein